jgi:hypothetical protein
MVTLEQFFFFSCDDRFMGALLVLIIGLIWGKNFWFLDAAPRANDHALLFLRPPPPPRAPLRLWPSPSRPPLALARAAPAAWCRKSRRTGLRQRGQRGSASESITYMRQRGQAASTMDVASGLSDHCSPWPCRRCGCGSRSPSDDRHELGDDDDHSSSDEDSGDALLSAPPRAGAGGDRCSFRSRPPRLIPPCRCCLHIHP